MSPLTVLEAIASVPIPFVPPERVSQCPDGGSIVDRLEDNDGDGRIGAGDRQVTRYVACRIAGVELNREQIVEIRQLSWNGRDSHWVARVMFFDQPPTSAPPPNPSPGTIVPVSVEAALDVEYEHTPDLERRMLTGGSMTVSVPVGPNGTMNVDTLTDVLADVQWDRFLGENRGAGRGRSGSRDRHPGARCGRRRSTGSTACIRSLVAARAGSLLRPYSAQRPELSVIARPRPVLAHPALTFTPRSLERGLGIRAPSRTACGLIAFAFLTRSTYREAAMNRIFAGRSRAVLAGCVAGLVPMCALADITLQERISVQAAGAMSIVNMTGTSVTTVSGKRARMESDVQMQSRLARAFARGMGPTAEIVRLDDERLYELDIGRKQYREWTFAERRAELEKVIEQTGRAQEAQQQSASPVDESQCEWSEPTAKVKRTGEKASFAGYEAERLMITASQACKDRETGQVCEYALTLDQWLSPAVAGAEDLLEFQRAYAEKLGFGARGSRDLAQRAESMFRRYGGIWSQLADRMRDIEGYPVKTSFALAIGGPQCQAAQEAREAGAGLPTGADVGEAAARTAGEIAGRQAAQEAGQSALGGIAGQVGGRIAGALLRRKKEEQRDTPAEAPAQTAAPAAAGMLPIIAITSELVSVSQSPVDPGVFEVPAGFRKAGQ